MAARPEPRSGTPTSSTVAVDGLRLHCVSWGDPQAPPLVLVHGMRDHARSWDWTAAAFADRHHVIAPDLRGHGDSDHATAGGYAMADYVRDLAETVEQLGIGRAMLVGHSLGGAIALRYAAAFPDNVARLALIEAIELPIVRDERAAPHAFPDRLREWIMAERTRASRRPRSYATPAEAEARMAAQHPALAAETIRHLVATGITPNDAGGWRWKYDNAARNRAPDDADGRDLDAVLAAVACPTLLCYGDDSWIPLPPAERLALLRDHRIECFDGASHWLHHQCRDRFVECLADFLDDNGLPR